MKVTIKTTKAIIITIKATIQIIKMPTRNSDNTLAYLLSATFLKQGKTTFKDKNKDRRIVTSFCCCHCHHRADLALYTIFCQPTNTFNETGKRYMLCTNILL